MRYKGYTAAVEYDDSVGLLHGSVIDSGPYPIATFEAAGLEALREEFHRSVDDYLAWCEEDGVPPRLPRTGPASPQPMITLNSAQLSAQGAWQPSIWIEPPNCL